MIRKVSYILLLLVLTLVANQVQAQIPDEVITSLKTGNAAKLSNHFSDNIELVVLDNEDVYSKAHAKQVINDFFTKYPPKDFTIIHKGGKEGSNYAIGNLQVANEKFRVYFLIKSKNGALLIHQLRIERQNK